MENEAKRRDEQFCSAVRNLQAYKRDSLQRSDPSFKGTKERAMKTSTKDRIKDSFHQAKGTIKEEVGKATNNRDLKAEGKAEKKIGKVQERIGRAKEAVVKAKGQLSALKAR
jgi:uncharacterized protein YjbJ (UPF0337 family)